jgi:hypothetical protein
VIWQLLDNLLSRLVGRLLRLAPVDPGRPLSKRELKRFCKKMADEYRREMGIGR